MLKKLSTSAEEENSRIKQIQELKERVTNYLILYKSLIYFNYNNRLKSFLILKTLKSLNYKI